MDVLELLKGKKMMVETNMLVLVELEIKEVKESRHSEDLEPSTPQNDWWPATRDWVTYIVEFTNGAKKEFSNLNEIKIH